jgi:hypothetical protein
MASSSSPVGLVYERVNNKDAGGIFDIRRSGDRDGGVVLETPPQGGFKIGPRCVVEVRTGLKIVRYSDCVPAHFSLHLLIDPWEEFTVAPVRVELGKEIVLTIENALDDDVEFPAPYTVGEFVLVQKFLDCVRESEVLVVDK